MAYLVLAKRTAVASAVTNPSGTFEGTAMIEIRFSQQLFESIHADLSRPHAFAAERVGFIACASGKSDDGGLILLAESYLPVEDEHYVDNPKAGATMGPSAIRSALQFAYNRPVSMYHIHRHEHRGVPRFSGIDLRESRIFVPDFFKVQPHRSHGVIVLSHDSATGLCWNPGMPNPITIQKFVVVGRPTSTVRSYV